MLNIYIPRHCSSGRVTLLHQSCITSKLGKNMEKSNRYNKNNNCCLKIKKMFIFLHSRYMLSEKGFYMHKIQNFKILKFFKFFL